MDCGESSVKRSVSLVQAGYVLFKLCFPINFQVLHKKKSHSSFQASSVISKKNKEIKNANQSQIL